MTALFRIAFLHLGNSTATLIIQQTYQGNTFFTKHKSYINMYIYRTLQVYSLCVDNGRVLPISILLRPLLLQSR